MSWFNKVKSPKLKSSKKIETNTPSGLWKKCTNCSEIVQSQRLEETYQVCPYCDHHFRLSAKERITQLLDEDSFLPIGQKLTTTDPLGFVDKKPYGQRLEEAKSKTGLVDGTYAGTGKVNGKEVAIAIMNFQFMGGSMGVVTGEKVARVMDLAYEKKIPCIVVSCSGGARMQEGLLSLMQMGKTSASRQRLKNAGIPYISLLTDPTTGGVAASFAMVGDLNIAEPKALIGFAGPRVIEQSIRQKLPQGFQRSEFLLDHGFIDRIVHRHKLKEELSFFIDMFSNEK
ncbi:acetyl-CoA carboxylase, carboxyltransferase subunit beta [Halobacteriovorax sp. GB3]|uniref:acetyl-CoA carboxylase, carboxyltransferase subunit beta n=1 Tax=Halobacteriovorax sp. GB3 TaxID=2719615 RepID=UPI0023611AE3|nr:acetyl-CoA carboxylase, carboxyltransferase subunit beta [Halobacteriovorax sp. GB3]MDD0852684.1 acetyl-CoA carboxylase, carboxyltransferase subunit beta [Halobacteriovorax sp. GB3]